MALGTLGELNAALTQYTARATLTSLYPGFIGLTESMFNYGDGEINFRPLRVRDMESGPATITVTGNSGALPEGFLEAKRVTRSSDGGVVSYLTQEAYADRYPNGDTGTAANYTVIGANIIVAGDVALVYYARIPTLVGGGDAATNWLLGKAPNAYLYGALYHYAIYAKQLDKANGYFELMRRSLAALNIANSFSPAGGMAVRAGSVATP